MAKLLVERHNETFASRYPREESTRRLARAIDGFAPKGMVFETAWRDQDGAAHLDLATAPSKRTRAFLHTTSVVLTLLVAAAIACLVLPGEAGAARVAVALASLMAMLAFPFVMVAYGSRREAEESVLRRKIRKALVEEEA